MKFLLIEDDKTLAGAVEKLLGKHRYVTDLATDGIAGRDMAESFDYDLILLDWTLPKLDGLQLCKYLRSHGNSTPIIVMTARDNNADRVAALDAGADDYLVKPFETTELLARIRALLRRSEGIISPILQWGDLSLDPRNSKVTCQGKTIAATPKEYALLELFLRNPNRIFSLNKLLDQIWPFDDSPHVGAVRTHVKGLRHKIKRAGLPDMISTVYGLGYRLNPYQTAAAIAQPLPKIIAQPFQSRSVSTEVRQIAPPTSPPTSPPHQNSHQDSLQNSTDPFNLSTLWDTVRATYQQRLAQVERTLRSLQPGPIDPTVHHQLLAEAHSFAGSLGSFDLVGVTEQCREIESILHGRTQLDESQIHRMGALIDQVKQTLAQGIDKRLGRGTDKGINKDIDRPAISPIMPQKVVSKAISMAPSEIISEISPIVGNHAGPYDFSLDRPSKMLIVTSAHSRHDKDLHQPDDQPDNQQKKQDWLTSIVTAAPHHRIQVSIVDGTEAANQAIARVSPDIVLLELNGFTPPASSSPEYALLAELQSTEPPIPTLVLTAAASFEARVSMARMGVSGFLQVPITPTEVLETAAQILQKGVSTAAKLLIVDDDPSLLSLLQSLLSPWGFQIQLLSRPQHFWQALEHFEPDLVLLDVEMPHLTGFDLCQVLRNSSYWQEIPVLFMSVHTDATTIQQVFSVGGDDYVRKPIVAPELVARVLSWLERSRIRQLRADVDSLTGIANRRKSTQLLTRLLRLAQRQAQSFCFVLIDFDHFKQINDDYGHPVGDRILRCFGESLRTTFRSEDVIGRWGGEEFIVGLYGVSRQESTERLQTFLQTWKQKQFDIDTPAAPLTCTFSAGIAIYPDDGADVKSLYHTADEALYTAKLSGRGQVCSTAVNQTVQPAAHPQTTPH